jgi:hypothetical protein
VIGYTPEIKTIYNRLKGSAKSRGIPFNLSITDLNNLTYPITCPILGIPIRFNRNKAEENSISIDRIDSSKGYEIDNIIVVSLKANKLKSNATKEELQKLSEFYKNL